jgi:hypothetical protein
MCHRIFSKNCTGPTYRGSVQKEYTMSKSISTNLKLIVKQRSNLPLELTAASVELLADAAT